MSTGPNALTTAIRGKFPGAYDDISDADLTKNVLAKHPEYSDMVPEAAQALNPTVSKPPLPNQGKTPFEASPLAKEQPQMLAAPIAPAGAAASYPGAILGTAGGYLGSKIGERFGPWGRDLGGIAGGLLGTGAGDVVGGVAKNLKFNPKTEISTPFGQIKIARDIPSAGHTTPLGPDAGEFYENRGTDLMKRSDVDPLADAVKQGIASKLPTRIPKPNDPVLQAVREGRASKLPTRIPEPPVTPMTESPYYDDFTAARSVAKENANTKVMNQPVWAESLPGRVPRPNGGALGRVGGNPDVGVYPEPREPLPQDKPGVMYSVKRGTVLPESAKRGAPGAADVLKNIGKPVLFEPKEGTGYSGARTVDAFDKDGNPLGKIKAQ